MRWTVNRKRVTLWICVTAAAVALSGGGCEPAGVTRKYYYTQTDDGITLALRRYRSAQVSAENAPVILCHGLSYNLLFWDLREDVSLPIYLARKGYDVWSLSLRGAAPSSQPLNSALRKLAHFNIDPETLKTLQKRIKDVKMTNWSVDDHIEYDVPAAIRFVQKETRHRQVHWIGHSMGGMIMFAYLGQGYAESGGNVKSFVAISVPMAVFHPLSKPLEFLLETQPALQVGSHIVGSSAPATWGVIFGDLNTPMNKLFYNNENVDDGLLRDLFRRAEEEISPDQFKQLLNMIRTERFMSLDGSIDYTAQLAKVTTPAYFMAGTLDNLATAGAVRYAYRQVGSEIKKFGLFGRINSHHNDYGHNDMIIGKNAKKEVYPTILEWLNRFPNRPYERKLLLQPATSGEK